jgi:hypothetical protein
MVALSFVPLHDLFGESNTFVIFGIVSIISFRFIITTIPDTKGLNLEQIEANIGVFLTHLYSHSLLFCSFSLTQDCQF